MEGKRTDRTLAGLVAPLCAFGVPRYTAPFPIPEEGEHGIEHQRQGLPSRGCGHFHSSTVGTPRRGRLTGTKFGCGLAQCGACTVLLDGQPSRTCMLRSSSPAGKKITTIEGLSDDATHPVQKAWAELDVPQCGYCQAGQMMSASALLAENQIPPMTTSTSP